MRHKSQSFSLRYKLIITYIAVVLVAISILGGFLFSNAIKSNREQMLSAYSYSADMVTNQLVNQLNSYGNHVYLIAQNAPLSVMLSSSSTIYDKVYWLNSFVEPQIYFYLTGYEGIEKITVYSEQDIPSSFFTLNDSVKNTQWYKDTTDQFGACWRLVDQQLYVTSRIQTYVDTIGVVELQINFVELLESVISNEHMHFVVFDEKNQTPIYPLTIPQKQSTWPRSTYAVVGTKSLPGTGLSIQFYIDNRYIYRTTLASLQPAIAVTLTCIVISGVLVALFLRYISRRLDRMTQAVEGINEQNFLIDLPENDNDELGLLSVCLNSMSRKIQHLFDEVHRIKEQEKKAKIDALQAKINPHFLYNIMDTINWYAMDGDKETICDITRNLALYYRTNLNSGLPHTTVRRELINAKAYVYLQMLLRNHSFDIEYDIDEQAYACEICNFILQPVIENAIMHGFGTLTDRRGMLHIRLFVEGERLFIQVRDNGVGMSDQQLKSIWEKQGGGYGLKNVRDRIVMAYGESYGVFIESTQSTGTCVTLELPRIVKTNWDD